MTRSMTAYASAESATAFGAVVCELRSVNHRYLDQSLRLPEELRAFEPAIREKLAARLARGKVDAVVRLRDGDNAAQPLALNEQRVEQLMQAACDIHNRRPDLLRVEFTELLRYPGVVAQTQVDADTLKETVMAVLDEALDALIDSREREGAKLAAAISQRLDAIAAIVAGLRKALPEIRSGLRARLESRLADLKQPLEPGRLEQELVLQLTRVDVDEELDRLETHVAEAHRVLGLSEPVGRRLDFLMQEFNREANTLGSKSVDARSTNAAVELKVLIEQMREQVQNIE